MDPQPTELATEPLLAAASGEAPPRNEHQALWFVLARRQLTSVVFVPADPETPVADLANGVAEVGRRLGDAPVTAIVAEEIDYAFVARTAALLASTHKGTNRFPGTSPLEVLVAIHPVAEEPLGLALAQAADAVVLCIRMGHTRIDAARATIDLVGRDRILGVVALR